MKDLYPNSFLLFQDLKQQIRAQYTKKHPCRKSVIILDQIDGLRNQHILGMRIWLGEQYKACFSNGSCNVQRERFLNIVDKEVHKIFTERFQKSFKTGGRIGN